MNCILNDIAKCNFYFSDYVRTFTVTISSQEILCTKTSENTLIAVVHLTINIFSSNYQRLHVVFTAANLLSFHPLTTADTLHK